MPRYSNFKFKFNKYQTLSKYFILNMFINRLMLKGKKNRSMFVLKTVFLLISKRCKIERPYIVFLKCLLNLAPSVKLKTISIEDTLVHFAEDCNLIDSMKSSITLLIEIARKKRGKTFIDNLTNEIIESANYKGISIRRRQEKDILIRNKIKFANKKFN